MKLLIATFVRTCAIKQLAKQFLRSLKPPIGIGGGICSARVLLSPMARTYKLTLSPMLLTERPHKGHLGYVTFIASSGDKTVKTFAVNRGDLGHMFAKLVPGVEAAGIIHQLMTGHNVELPGTFNALHLAELGFRMRPER